MLNTLAPLRARRNLNPSAYRSQSKRRNLEVHGTEIILRNSASSYSIDLSDVHGGERSYSLNTSQTNRGNHEVTSFEIVLILPAVNPPTVTFPFLRWADFAGLYRLEPGRGYLISVFRVGQDWIGALSGSTKIPTLKTILGRTEGANTAGIVLQDYKTSYLFSADGEPVAFAFDTGGLSTEKQVLCFDLLVRMQAAITTLDFPVTKWFDFCLPPTGRYTAGETYAFTFLSLDGGSNWIGRYNTKI